MKATSGFSYKQPRPALPILLFALAMPCGSAIADSEFSTEVGLGYDSNIYRAPFDGSYSDYSIGLIGQVDGNGNPVDNTVNSSVKDGTYVPLRQTASFTNKLSNTSVLSADLDFRGQFYTDSAYANANQYKYQFDVGYSQIFAERKSKINRLYGGFVIGHTRRLYLDRDTGVEKVYSDTNPTDISERYIFDTIGMALKYEDELAALQHEFNFEYELRDFRNVPGANEMQYDHTYILLSGDVAYRVTKSTKASVKYSYSTYDYDERTARTLQGKLLRSSPKRFYEYNTLDLTLRQRLTKPLVVYLDYEIKTRKDDYVGYHNYDKTKIKLRVNYDINKRTKAKFAYWTWDRNYDKAFAYDEPFKDANSLIPMEKLEYDGTGYSLKLVYDYSKQSSIEFAYKYNDDNSTDFRYDYERSIATVSYLIKY